MMIIETYLSTIVGSSLLSAFLLLLFLKLEGDEWVHNVVPERIVEVKFKLWKQSEVKIPIPFYLLHQLVECSFCLSWWTNLLICVLAAMITGDWFVMTAALLCTPITRKLI